MAQTAVRDILRAEYKRRKPGEGWNKDRRRDYLLRLKFGVTLVEYLQMLEDQNHSCAICHRPFDASAKQTKPHVDHRHSDGKVRGLLCHACNFAIGLLQDDLLIAESAVEYLKKHSIGQ